MRLFIAINFNNDTKARLLGLRDKLKEKAVKGDFSLAENMHLTLVFLGECDTKQAAVIKSVMDEVNFKPFEAAIGRVGRFRRDGGDVWWAGVQESEPLLELQRELTDKLAAKGFDIEKRKYSPHITLGRRVTADVLPENIEAFGERICAFELMKSERVNGRMVYTEIHKSTGKNYD